LGTLLEMTQAIDVAGKNDAAKGNMKT